MKSRGYAGHRDRGPNHGPAGRATIAVETAPARPVTLRGKARDSRHEICLVARVEGGRRCGQRLPQHPLVTSSLAWRERLQWPPSESTEVLPALDKPTSDLISRNAQMSSPNCTNACPDRAGHERAVRILACSLLRELTKQGCDVRYIIDLASELIGLTCESIRSSHEHGLEPDGHTNQSPWMITLTAHHSIDVLHAISSHTRGAEGGMETARTS
jgi:hypothetical protein